jgi:hypothetical protein
LSAATGRADQHDMFIIVSRRGFGATETDGEARQERGQLVGGVGADRFLFHQILDARACCLGTPAATGRASHQQQRPVAQVDQPVASANRKQFGKDITAHCLLALPLSRSAAGANGKPKGALQRRRRKRPGQPTPARRIDQLVNRRRTVAGACGPALLSKPLTRRALETSSGIPLLVFISRSAGSHK